MGFMDIRRIKITPLTVFILINIISAFAFLVLAFRHGGDMWHWLAMNNIDDNFFDYKIHVAFVADRKHLYERMTYYAGCFPALAYCMYYFLYKIISVADFVPADNTELENLDFLNSVILYYTIFVLILFFLTMLSYTSADKKRAVVTLFASLLMTVPVYECLMIGNSVFLVMTLLLLACKLRQSNKPLQRETALILIAVCAGFKIYPAVMGLLYLKEKRFKEAIRLTIYGILLFFLPFAFFGGADGFKLWMDNVKQTMGMMGLGRIQCIKELAYSIFTWNGIAVPDLIYQILPIVFVILMIIFAWFTRYEHRRLFYLCAIMMFFPTSCCRYTLCLLIIPLMTWFFGSDRECGDAVKAYAWDYIEVLLYTGVFAIPVIWGRITHFKWELGYYMLSYVEVWIYIFAYGLLTYNMIRDIVSGKKAALSSGSTHSGTEDNEIQVH
ncbi:MAG: DUF2029 domain-containing protein [Lachnospiraceae bacterium]|nr:DUF2029 domain-containing protein [Lachnospiraceae bacterium]